MERNAKHQRSNTTPISLDAWYSIYRFLNASEVHELCFVSKTIMRRVVEDLISRDDFKSIFDQAYNRYGDLMCGVTHANTLEFFFNTVCMKIERILKTGSIFGDEEKYQLKQLVLIFTLHNKTRAIATLLENSSVLQQLTDDADRYNRNARDYDTHYETVERRAIVCAAEKQDVDILKLLTSRPGFTINTNPDIDMMLGSEMFSAYSIIDEKVDVEKCSAMYNFIRTSPHFDNAEFQSGLWSDACAMLSPEELKEALTDTRIDHVNHAENTLTAIFRYGKRIDTLQELMKVEQYSPSTHNYTDLLYSAYNEMITDRLSEEPSEVVKYLLQAGLVDVHRTNIVGSYENCIIVHSDFWIGTPLSEQCDMLEVFCSNCSATWIELLLSIYPSVDPWKNSGRALAIVCDSVVGDEFTGSWQRRESIRVLMQHKTKCPQPILNEIFDSLKNKELAGFLRQQYCSKR
jgi:hypothetical protein